MSNAHRKPVASRARLFSLPVAIGMALHAATGLSPDRARGETPQVAPKMEGAYQLGPGDKLRLSVAEWRPSEGTSRDWSALDGEYRVGPDGGLALPFIGRLSASGRSANEIAAEIGPLLRSTLGLDGEPSASLEVIEYRPVFVTGEVRQPGMYPYIPGMSVVKAVAVAGGLRTAASDDERASNRAYIQAAGQLALKETERTGLAARMARLRAEADGSDEISFPADLKGRPGFVELQRGERAVLAARRARLERQKASLVQLQELLVRELEAFETKIAFQEEQRAAVRKELAGIRSLAKKGLAANNRVRSVSQALAQVETNILNIESDRFRARQDLNRAERDLKALEDERGAEIAAFIQEAEAELLANAQSTAMLQSLALDARAAAQAVATPVGTPVTRYTITRETGSAERESAIVQEVLRTTRVRPGDVIEVTIEMPDATAMPGATPTSGATASIGQ